MISYRGRRRRCCYNESTHTSRDGNYGSNNSYNIDDITIWGGHSFDRVLEFLLFTGDFKRSGPDLVLSKDGHDLVVQDYFRGATRAALASPDGAQLSGSIVDALTGQVIEQHPPRRG